MSTARASKNDIKRMVRYDPDTGRFFNRKTGEMFHLKTGKQTNGELAVKIGNSLVMAKRIAYLSVYDCWPNFKVNYSDGDKHNLKWSNLFESERLPKCSRAVKNFNLFKIKKEIVEGVEFVLKSNPNKDSFIKKLREKLDKDSNIKRMSFMDIGDIIDELNQ